MARSRSKKIYYKLDELNPGIKIVVEENGKRIVTKKYWGRLKHPSYVEEEV